MIPGFGLVMMLACAAFFYHAGEEEHSSGILLAGVSIGLWFAAGYFFAFGWLGSVLVQVGVFAVLTVWNLVRDKIKK